MDIVELAKKSTTYPSDFGWYGRQDMFITWGWAGVDMHRDSNILDTSNFNSVIETLKEEFEGDEFDENFDVVGLRHWAVGHADRLTVRVVDHAVCKFCGSWIEYVNDYDEVRNWHNTSWWWQSEKLVGYDHDHTPADITEDQITIYFKRVMEIVHEIREITPIWDEHDFNERESVAEIEYIDLIANDYNWCVDHFKADKVSSWLHENDFYHYSHDSDGTPMFYHADIAIGIYMTHQELADYSDPDDFWRGWQEENIQLVRQRVENDMAEAGQEKMF